MHCCNFLVVIAVLDAIDSVLASAFTFPQQVAPGTNAHGNLVHSGWPKVSDEAVSLRFGGSVPHSSSAEELGVPLNATPQVRRRRTRKSKWSSAYHETFCRRYSRHGRCKFGEACRFKHTLGFGEAACTLEPTFSNGHSDEEFVCQNLAFGEIPPFPLRTYRSATMDAVSNSCVSMMATNRNSHASDVNAYLTTDVEATAGRSDLINVPVDDGTAQPDIGDACNDTCIGADHRGLKLPLALTSEGRKGKAKGTKSMRGWKPVDAEDFRQRVDARVHASKQFEEYRTQHDLDKACMEIEDILTDIGRGCSEVALESQFIDIENQKRLHELIGNGRAARLRGCKTEVRDLSKIIRKEFRAVTKAKKNMRISRVLEEFKDLRRIADIRG